MEIPDQQRVYEFTKTRLKNKNCEGNKPGTTEASVTFWPRNFNLSEIHSSKYNLYSESWNLRWDKETMAHALIHMQVDLPAPDEYPDKFHRQAVY